MILVVEQLLSLFLQVKEYSIRDLITKTKAELLKEDVSLERIIYLRKYSGRDQLKGILEYIPENSPIIDFDKIHAYEKLHESNVVLGPLNIEELTSYYQKLFKNEKSVYPIVHPILASKFFKNIIFYPWIPKHVYIPEGSIHLIQKFDFDEYFKNLHVDYVIVKDEYGFHTGQMVPYTLIKIGNINKGIKSYTDYADKIDNFGGVIVEEFIGNKTSIVYKNHIFGEIIPHESIKYTVHLNRLEGVLKSYSPAEKSLLEKVESEPHDTNSLVLEKLNPLIKKYLPYLFSSFDFVMNEEQNPIVIDVNSIAGSLGEIQEMIGTNDHNPFEFFYIKCKTFPNNEFTKQEEYLKELNKKYIELKLLEGIYTVINGKIKKLF